jgi:hypothetical protein
MDERCSHVAESPKRRRLGTGWSLDAVFPNGETVMIRGIARECEASELPSSFRHLKSTCANSGGDLGARAALARDLRAKASDSTVAAPSPTRTGQVPSHVNDTVLEGQPFPETVEWPIPSAPGLIALASKIRTRVSEKWRAETSNPWFALLCASSSFAALLAFTIILAGVALTKQPARSGVVTVPRAEIRMIERNHDDDPIAALIEQTSAPEGPSVEPASSRPSPF